MVNNVIEAWYWIFLLAALVGVGVYYSLYSIRNLWAALKEQREEGQDTVSDEVIMTPYSRRIVIIHWLTVALLVVVWYLGDSLAGARGEKSATLAGYYAHVLAGGAVLVLTLLRWTFRNVDGVPPPAGNSLVDMMARGVHYGLYILLVLLSATGLMTALTSGVGPALLKANASLLPEKYTGPATVPHIAHEILMDVLIVVVIVHVLGAITHQFILKDGLMGRMSLRGKS
ncbi:MAG: cytochrome b/b6 domain-containing protein [Nitrosomonadales bacterium]|nr:cytochrome b/b6 domain-containing protein [Nitrosomonadales bacterium]